MQIMNGNKRVTCKLAVNFYSEITYIYLEATAIELNNAYFKRVQCSLEVLPIILSALVFTTILPRRCSAIIGFTV